MPSPIKPNNTNDYGISFLPTISPESLELNMLSSYASSDAGDSEAEMLIDLWNNGKRLSGHLYSVPNGFPSRSLTRLQSSGLISLNGKNVEFTSKASRVIKTMVLAEQNSFYQKRQKKPYSLILAESKRPVRKSNLTHTAQRITRVPDERTPYVTSRRYVKIDRSKNEFKEYTIRVFYKDGHYELWGFSGRIGGTQTGWPKGSFNTHREVQQAFEELTRYRTRVKGYELGSIVGEARDGGRVYDLTQENSSIPGVSNTSPTSRSSQTPPTTPETSRNNPPPRRPSTPSQAVSTPTAPPVVPTKHVEDRSLPENYKIEGPARVGIDSQGRPLTGYFVIDPQGKPIHQSIGDTSEQALLKAGPILSLRREEAKLPPGYTLIGPPRDSTPRGLFITRAPNGLPIGTEPSARAAVEKAIEWSKQNPNVLPSENKPKTNEDPLLIEQTKKASELSSQLPRGYKFENGMKGYDPKSWFVIDDDGNPVSIRTPSGNQFASGKSPQEALDKLNELKQIQMKNRSNELMEMMRKRIKSSGSKIKTANEDLDQSISEEPVLGFYHQDVNGNNVENQKRKTDFLNKSAAFLSKVGSLLRPYGFSSHPYIFEGGPAIPGWVSCTYWTMRSDCGLRAIIGFDLDNPITPTISFNTISKSGDKMAGHLFIHPCAKGPEEMVKTMLAVYQKENPDFRLKYLPDDVRELYNSLQSKMKSGRK